jgi:hypothetical protein
LAVPYILKKFFQNLEGLDLRSSDLVRSQNAATLIKNADFRDTGALNKRKGYQYLVRGDQGSGNVVSNGLAVWEDFDSATGAVNERLVSIGDALYEKLTDSITLTYTGSGIATYDVTLNATTLDWEFIIEEDGVVVTTQNLGDGTDPSDMTISTLVTNLNGLTDFTCTGGSLSGSEKAAFIPTVVAQTVASTGTGITYHYWSAIDTPSGHSTPFSGHYAKKNDTSFENATFAQLNDVLYISTGYDEMQKFDGNRVYAAGLPQGVISSVTDAGAGSTFSIGNKFDYKIEYEYKDARENIITGQISSVTSLTKAAADDNTVVVHNIKESAGTVSNLGFNLDQATVNGNQSGVTTITVASGHDIKIGDYVYLLDGVTSSVVNRKVTATTTTSITIEGAAVDVNNNEIISNVKIYVYRTINYSASGVPGLFYLAKELVNDSGNDTQTFTDSVSDANLQANLQYVEPIKAHGLPPKCKYMTTWRGQLVMAGNVESVDTVYYSDIVSPEYFPPADQSFEVDRPVTGLFAQDNVLYVFERSRIHGVTGDFGTDNFIRTLVSKEGIGCEAHATIAEVEGSVYFLSRQGVYSMSQQQGLTHIGAPIDPRFTINSSYAFKQAVGFNHAIEDKYMLFLPIIGTLPGNTLGADDTTSEIYVFDYFRKAWLQWSNFNFMGGIVTFDDELHFIRRTESGGAEPDVQLIKLLKTDTEYDYSDHTQPITFNYATHWETLGEPSVWKKFLRVKFHSIDSTLRSFETDAFNLEVSAQHNFEPSINVGNFTVDFSGGAEGWGIGPWGEFPWGEARLKGAKKKLASKKVRSHRLRFDNSTLHENVLISGYELEIATSYRPNIKE